LERLQVLAADPEQLSLEVRSFVVAFATFNEELKPYRNLLSGLKTFSPLIDGFDEIDSELSEGRDWLMDYMDEKMDYMTLTENLKETAQGLEAILDGPPVLFREIPQDTPTSMQETLDDVETLGERIWETVREKGYDLFHVLIGAA
jgi:hypothetical protein